MSLYCDTFDVAYLSQVEYQQLGFASAGAFGTWIAGTLIPIADDFIDNWVGHDFFDHNPGTITLDGNGKEALSVTRQGLVDGVPPRLLPLPLISVGTITVDGVAITGYKVYRSHVVYEDNTFDSGRQNVVLTARYGYTAVPDDVKYVAAQLCANVLTEMVRRRKLPDLATPIMEGGGDVGALFRTPRVLTDNEKAVLDRYRIREVDAG